MMKIFFITILSLTLFASQSYSETFEDLFDGSNNNGNIMNGLGDIAGAGQDIANSTCLCYPYIKNSFNSIAEQISSKLSQQESALAKLKNTLKDTNKEFKYQNIFLKKENELMKEEILKDMELIFYLKQKNELK
ncbi:hypothetical protein [Helicobacter labetoulli]|uniref:hypothetical protein n=1 Tax=Helicobacter labetoulli TaxID=2315333 RepID=UPI00130026CE|nr:hypothetical protein [Helicobacter labetoulli]